MDESQGTGQGTSASQSFLFTPIIRWYTETESPSESLPEESISEKIPSGRSVLEQIAPEIIF